MPEFVYRAATVAGRIERGVMEATSAAALERALVEQGLFPLDIGARAPRAPMRVWRRRRAADVADGIYALATLVGAGFPLERALDTAAGVSARPDVSAAFLDVLAQVRAGNPLSAAFAANPDVFPRAVVGLTRAGERGEHLAEALSALAEHLEWVEDLKAELWSALLYPLLLVVVGGAAIGVMLLYVLPRFAAVFADLGTPLPALPTALLALGRLAARAGPVTGGLLVALGVGLTSLVRSGVGRRWIDELLLRLPLVGAVRRRVAAAQVGRSLAASLAAGTPILAALDLAADTASDTAIRTELTQVREEVRGGHRLGEALRRRAAFPYLFVQMVAFGEESGTLAPMVRRAAERSEQELRRGMARAVRVLEPTLIVLFGVVTALVAFALLQTIYGFRIDSLR